MACPPQPVPVDAERFCAVRSATELLAAPLSAEDQTAQSMPDVSPTKWHRAHTTWFFETFLLESFQPDFCPFEVGYRVLFNSYYNGIGAQYPRPERGAITRPGIDEITGYRHDVDRRVLDVMADSSDATARRSIEAIVELGLHHEQQHQELLLMDIKHVLSRNPLRPTYRIGRPPTRSTVDPISWLDLETATAEVGHTGDGFCFDNELPRHRHVLAPFALADRLTTNGEWLAFIDDGGYRRPELWLSDGWDTVRRSGWEAPLYWERDGAGWIVHTLHGTQPLEPSEPVAHVSHFEADAYARWAGARLPTEQEWEHAVTTLAVEPSPAFDVERLHPRLATESSAATIRQAFGVCWQWTASAYLGYPGFRIPAGAVGEYNGKFMSGQMVLRGSSALTPGGHARPTYRNFFPPAARWPMTGVRLARDR
ncbi:MAG: ergothioneine biosynthesis protein EgtB [Ilumatobacteraceae bacterium]